MLLSVCCLRAGLVIGGDDASHAPLPCRSNEPFQTLKQFTDPFLSLFRGVIPSIGGMDLSPMLGFFLLRFVANQLRRVAMGM